MNTSLSQAAVAELAGVSRSDVCNYEKGRMQYVTLEKQKRIRRIKSGMSQTELVDAHLSRGWTITPAEAYTDYGILRLSERVRELNARYQRNGDTRRIINTQTGRGIGKYAIYQMVNTEEK